MKNLSIKFYIFNGFVASCLVFAGYVRSTSQAIEETASTISVLTPAQYTTSAEWFCDARWESADAILAGTIKKVVSSEKLSTEKLAEAQKYLPEYRLKNLLRVEVEKVYKGSEKNPEIEILNLENAQPSAINFAAGEKYLFYLKRRTIHKNETLFYFLRPDGDTELFAESSETIAFLEASLGRNISDEILGPNDQEIVFDGIIGGRAIKLVKPAYPNEIKKDKISGRVQVYILVDESGHVIEAEAICPPHPSLGKASEQAALASQFSPYLYKGKAVKVKGVLVYNFVP